MGTLGAMWWILASVLGSAAPRATAADQVQIEALATKGVWARGPVSYLAVESGHVFRMLGGGPVLGPDGSKLALVVSYIGDTRQLDAAVKAAEELMAALGPGLHASGERIVVIQARAGFDPQSLVNRTVAFHVTFEHAGDRWFRLPVRLPRGVETIGDGPLVVADDAEFPLDEKELARAGHAASRWMMALAAGDGDSLRSLMGEGLLEHVSDAEVRFDSLAKASKGSAYRELFRMQTRSSPALSDRGVIVQFLWGSKELLSEIFELGLVREKGEWRVRSLHLGGTSGKEQRGPLSR